MNEVGTGLELRANRMQSDESRSVNCVQEQVVTSQIVSAGGGGSDP